MNGWMDGWMDERNQMEWNERKRGINKWMNKRMNEWTNEPMNETKEWRKEGRKEGMNEWMNGPKERGACICMEWTSCVRVLLWMTGWLTLCDHLLGDDVVDIWNRALATVLCTFCRPRSPIEAQNRGNRDPPSATMAATLPENKARFRARECFQSWIQSLTLPNYLHDDVVAMMIEVMMWLPSWWES